MSFMLTVVLHSTSVLQFAERILLGKNGTQDYNNLGPYGAPTSAAYPWATVVP